MAWVKLTDDFTEHPKVLGAGPLAGWLWISALAWSNRNGTDGQIPRAQVSRLASFDGIGVYTGNYTGEDADPRKLAEQLVAAGLFDPVDGGYVIHDYADYQLTTDELAKRREQKSEAGRKGADSRWHSSRHDTSHSSGHGSTHGTAMARIPVPEDPSLVVSPSGRDPASPVDDDETIHGVRLGDVYDHVLPIRYAANKANVRNRTKWEHKTRANLPAEIGARARELLERFDADAYTVAEVIEGRRSATYLTTRSA